MCCFLPGSWVQSVPILDLDCQSIESVIPDAHTPTKKNALKNNDHYFYDLQFSLSTSLFCPNMPISTHQYTKALLVNVIIENFVAYSCLIYLTKVHIWQQIKLMLGTWSSFMIIWQSNQFNFNIVVGKKTQSDNFSNFIYDTW